MTVSFADARRIAAERLEPEWTRPLGTFHVAETGYEDTNAYRVIVGAREWLVGGDDRFVEWDAPAYFVRKSDGELLSMPVILVLDTLEKMTPVSASSADGTPTGVA